MKVLISAGAVTLALGLSSAALAQDRTNASSKGAVVVELEAPTFEDVTKGRASKDTTYYQKGNDRSSAKRGGDAAQFCNRINYKFGLVLKYETIETEMAKYDYLKRIVCYD